MAIRTAMEWLDSCSGCEIAFLNIGEDLISLLTEKLDLLHAPLLMDNKYHGQNGEREELSLPECDLGIVSGGVANEEHLDVLFEMRKKCRILVAMGTCASHGGIPALMNGQDRQQSWEGIFSTVSTDSESKVPKIEVPAPLKRVYACDEKVEIDYILPGCAPNPKLLLEFLLAIIEDRKPVLPGKSVCDTCRTIRTGKGDVSAVKRSLTNCTYDIEEPISKMRCLLEQGYLCMGPVTAAGCSMENEPRCIHARVACRGCFGPVRRKGHQLLDMMNAFASNGIEYKHLLDRRSILRFSGAHGRLRPLKKS